VADELIHTGKVERGYLGVMISDDKRLLSSFGADHGVLVEDTVDGRSADQAGLKPGDVITAVDGQRIDNAVKLRRQIAKADPGQTVQLTVFREGRQETLKATLEQQPVEDLQFGRSPQKPRAEPGDSVTAEALAKLGLDRLQTVTPEIARRYDLGASWGVLVLEVRPFSAAAISGIGRGDVITHALGQKVNDVDELREAVEGRDLNRGVRMRVRIPDGPARFVLLSLEDFSLRFSASHGGDMRRGRVSCGCS
jgi:serine protease Do